MSTNTLYTYTCNFCDAVASAVASSYKWIGTMSIVALTGMIAFTENAGRARAARELARQGYYEEAKALMLEMKEISEEASKK